MGPERLDAIVAALQHTPIFAGLDSDGLSRLSRRGTYHTFTHGQVIVEPSDDPTGITIIAAGTARLYRSSPDGREITLGIYRTGDIVGLDMFWQRPTYRSTLCSAAAYVSVVTIPRNAFRDFLAKHPRAAMVALEMMAEQLASLSDRVEELALYPVRSRLAHELARQAERRKTREVDGTHSELAAWIGTNPEEVTKGLRLLREERLITSTPHQRGITVERVEQLADYGKDAG